jgi:hypothetical protein
VQRVSSNPAATGHPKKRGHWPCFFFFIALAPLPCRGKLDEGAVSGNKQILLLKTERVAQSASALEAFLP